MAIKVKIGTEKENYLVIIDEEDNFDGAVAQAEKAIKDHENDAPAEIKNAGRIRERIVVIPSGQKPIFFGEQ